MFKVFVSELELAIRPKLRQAIKKTNTVFFFRLSVFSFFLLISANFAVVKL